ncbi:MAG: trypsin-like peptidase domain-containing protein [Marmoricola sp.]|nr:trypsin-like peptidase domain-containing protein [Marmoricola sp.]
MRGRPWLPWIVVAVLLLLVAGLVGFLLGRGGSSGTTASSSSSDHTSVCPATSVAEKVLPSIVTISVAGAQGSGVGTGELFEPGGYVLTNEHVISPATGGARLSVRYSDGTTTGARLVGADAATDLAVIKADDGAPKRPLIDEGSSTSLKVGQPVVALGAPLGLYSTVTTGIVSALDRHVPVPTSPTQTAHLLDAIQTDAAINPGNSGGALVDCAGALVGVNSAIATVPNAEGVSGGGSSGLGFAIPVGLAKPIAEQLLKTGSANHPEIGVAAQTLPASVNAPPAGLVVTAVQPGSPAARAGLRAGDVITELAGRPASSAEQLVLATLGKQPGAKVSLTYVRDGRSTTVELTLTRP